MSIGSVPPPPAAALRQVRHLVTEIPGPRSRELMARKQPISDQLLDEALDVVAEAFARARS